MVAWLESRKEDDKRTAVVRQVRGFPIPATGMMAVIDLLGEMEMAALESLIDTDWEAVERLLEARHPTLEAELYEKREQVVEKELERLRAQAARKAFGGRQGGTPPAASMN